MSLKSILEPYFRLSLEGYTKKRKYTPKQNWTLFHESQGGVTLLQNQTWVHSPLRSKVNYWHWVVVKQSTAFIAGHQARRTGSSCSKDPKSLMAFREGVLKAVWGRGLRGTYQLMDNSQIGWHRGEISNFINLRFSSSLGSMFLLSVVFSWRGLLPIKRTQECVSGLYIFQETLSWVILLLGRSIV